MQFDKQKKIMCVCSLCGKILIERRPNGLWHFVFGKGFSDNKNNIFIPVEIYIQGNLKMRCLRRSCRKQNPDHWNVFNFWPGTGQEVTIGVGPNSKTTK